MKGTIFDFLKLTTEKPELAQDLVELASKHDFEFTDEELSEAELDSVAGGVTEEMSLRLQMTMDGRAKVVQTLSNIMKKISTTEDSLIQNIK